jgi:catechol 2,3-dioxygenase-like lactoylglutathione lyase family enzyme
MVERPPFTIGNLGEIAIRCRHYGAMVAFYRDIIGLEFLAETIPGISFFRLAPGCRGHTQVLALFAHDARRAGQDLPYPAVGDLSSLHHIALAMAVEEQAVAAQWLLAHGCKASFEDFAWIGWRGLFTEDPDGNMVELVAAVTPTV